MLCGFISAASIGAPFSGISRLFGNAFLSGFISAASIRATFGHYKIKAYFIMFLKDWIITTLLVLMIDGSYLFLTSAPFRAMIERIQGSALKANVYGIVFSYLAIVVLIVMFASGRKWWEVWLLGAAAYGLYDATNYALFKSYDKWIAMQDTVWGGTMFVLVVKAKEYLYKIV